MNKGKRFYIIISSLIVIIAIGVIIIVIFGFLNLSQKQASIAEKKYYTKKLNEKQQILTDLEKRYKDVEPSLVFIDNALPEEKDSSKLLADLNSLAVSSNLRLTFLEPDTSGGINSEKTSKSKTMSDLSLLQTVKTDTGYELPLEIRVTGSYKNFPGFIKRVENYQRLINIEAISIDKGEDESISDFIEARINIKAYLKK
jgi:Tfp pilus assembly protein PilO